MRSSSAPPKLTQQQNESPNHESVDIRCAPALKVAHPHSRGWARPRRRSTHLENPRPEKVAVVDEVKERLGNASAAILTEYRGLKVKDLADLRRSLTTAGGEYRIYKNT